VKDIYDIIIDFEKEPGTSLALATLVRVQGSSYRRTGARLLIRPTGRVVGSLSGGCIEEEIAQRATSVLQSGEPLLIDFDTRRQFGCHGKIDIFIERIEGPILRAVSRHLNERHPFTLTTTFASGEQPLGTRIAEMEGDFANTLIQVVHPPTRLLIFGEGPDSAPLHKLCDALGWQTLEFDDASAIAGIEVDEWTAAIVKSHNFGRDFAALSKLLPLDLRYVGLIGPKKRRDELLNELLQIDIPMNAGFFAPAGLDLNAETPEEIALSVVSEIQRVFADGSGKSLRDRKEPIHDRPASPAPPPNRWQTSRP
jgi:xanthine/CO dehydrogenase XdhC/CoxF family maturation factor